MRKVPPLIYSHEMSLTPTALKYKIATFMTKTSDPQTLTEKLDADSKEYFDRMSELERVKSNRITGVKSVLVMLSSRGMVFDTDSLTQKILMAYPDAVVFFRTTMGKSVGADCTDKVDLLIDFTGPGQRQGIFYAQKLRRMARLAVGRNAGFFRKKIYDRIFDEKERDAELPRELLERERWIQRRLLELAGVAFVQAGDTAPDRGKITPLELPPLIRA